jgi:von Willebrand factor type A domain
MRKIVRAAAALSALAAIAVACGSAVGSGFDTGSGGRDPGFTGGADSGSAGSGARGPGGGFSAGDSGLGGATCAQSVTPTKVAPALLVFIFDRSGSMSDSVGGAQTKWTALTPTLTAFFADLKSAGLSASLQFFAQPDECNVTQYSTPLVPMTALPSNAFAAAIAATEPDGDTPTQPALQGALEYATQQQKANPGSKVAVVLVTDGEPHDNCGSTVATVVAQAQTYAPNVPTYVIGVGKQLTRLDMIAEAGATSQAYLVATAKNDAGTSAAQAESDFESALDVIRSSQATCNLPIPAPPPGENLDFMKVNVVYDDNGQSQTLPYVPDCGGDAGGSQGWRYDDSQSPKTIVLCPGTCGPVQATATGQLSVELGCTTQLR